MADKTIETNSINLMDGIAGLRSLPSGSVDMLLTDPPYGTTRNYWDVPLPLPEFWAAVDHAVKPNGAILLFAQCPYDKILGASNLKMLRYEWVWYKDRGTGFLNARRMPLKKSENILVFYKHLPTYNPQYEYREPYLKTYSSAGLSPNYGKFVRSGSESNDGRRFPGNVIQFTTVNRTIHPTQKPVELCEYLIKTYTDEGAVIADICAGSGTTAIAAINTNRRFVCFENAPHYYALASERIRKAQKERGDLNSI
jgi:site-specific DNA-methyltransferase (adenine-specific)